MKIIKTGLASVMAASALFAGTYNVDPSHSNVGFKVKHLMISNVTGKFNKFDGSFEYDEKSGKITALNGVVDASSINTEDQKRDGHLKSADFFDVAKYPNITFKVSKVDDDKAYGKLTIKDVTKDVVFDVETTGTATDPWGNKRVGLEISGKINREDFGLTWNQALEAGGVLLGDTIKINVELEGILAK
ncbi:hypothetical protein CRV08_09495 [Halarcobacter ebronensis]|uniref:Lipid/polyisoprenoid-binding YceI-like domain-containing protein n=1 Tax=Halarcobacter ebronensis TaxID=1462615 RepID=A0A4Q0YCF3_9BACT|nr:YceI family protein [Halarcobacter ebronensis]RXJ68032.1 hypothetical protein CRV08_09495 [Halarcobacter ebronensis]